jgi:hypothetical protein
MTTSLLVLLAMVAVVTLVALVTWAIHQLQPERVSLHDETIVKKYRGKVERMPVIQVAEIKYHYHAVVGFAAVWEFLDKNDRSLLVDAEASGIGGVLAGLEERLPGFSLADFGRKFSEGDVEDSIDVWKQA